MTYHTSTMQPKTTTSNATWCLEQLFQYLELDVRNRVAAKTGRARNLEAAKLSNIGSSAALAHPSKARTPLSSGRWRNTDIPVTLPTKQNLRLRNVFMHYCSWADRDNYLYMSRTQFLRMCKEAQLMAPGLDGVELTLMFEKIHLESKEAIPGVKLGLNDWMKALLRIACHIYGDISPQEAFEKVVQDHILKHAPVQGADNDVLGPVVSRADVMEMLWEARVHLQPLFKFYVKEQELLDTGGGAGSRERYQARISMPFNSFMSFAQDFELVPCLLNKSQLAEAFRCARLSPTSAAAVAAAALGAGPDDGEGAVDSDEDMSRIRFEEFVEAIARIALMAYNYQEPPEEISTMGFKENYQPSAKRLWLDEVKQEFEMNLTMPDEVLMPMAGLDQCMGHDDSPHADDVMSRAASKVFTRARSVVGYKNKVMTAPGLEVMPVHDEQQVFQKDRPLHLTTFTTEWVGRPATPLTDTAKLMSPGTQTLLSQSKGWCSADQGLPPKYMSRAEHMIGARVNREQVMEYLKLNHQAEERKQKMANLSCAKTTRRQLQFSSGQTLTAGQFALYGKLPSQATQQSSLMAGASTLQGSSSHADIVGTMQGSMGPGSLRSGRAQSAPEADKQSQAVSMPDGSQTGLAAAAGTQLQCTTRRRTGPSHPLSLSVPRLGLPKSSPTLIGELQSLMTGVTIGGSG